MIKPNGYTGRTEVIMTNKDIIYIESQELAKQGKIKYTGREFKVKISDDKVATIKETEDIHTYQMWKQLGYQVMKGQKAVAQFSIWKYTSKTDDETGKDISNMFLKKASFFSRSQVEEI